MLELLAQAGEIFPEQVTTNSLTQNLVYALGTVGARRSSPVWSSRCITRPARGSRRLDGWGARRGQRPAA